MNDIEIRFKPSKKQYEAMSYLMDDKTKFVGYGGSAFSGKTYLLSYWLTIMSFAYPETAWGLCRNQLTVLKKTTLVTLFKVFNECGIKPNTHFSYNQQLNVIEFTNGSIIYLIDMAYWPSDPLYTRFGGLELTGAAIDESAESNSTGIEIISTRIGRRHNKKYGLTAKILETFNPAKNHVYQKYYKPFKEGKMKEGYEFIPALPTDNPSPEVPDYIKRIKESASKVTIERLIYGNFEYDDDPAILIDADSIADYFISPKSHQKNEAHIKGEGNKYLTIDVARKGRDKTIFRVWHGWLCIHRESMDISLIPQIVKKGKELMSKFGIAPSNTIADEDGVGGGVVDYLRCKGFINNSSPIEINEAGVKVKPNFDNLKSQCSIKMAEKIVSKQAGEVCDNPKVIDAVTDEMEQVKIKDIDKDGKVGVVRKDEVKEKIGRSPDEWDSIMMRYWFELKPTLKVTSTSTTGFKRFYP